MALPELEDEVVRADDAVEHGDGEHVELAGVAFGEDLGEDLAGDVGAVAAVGDLDEVAVEDKLLDFLESDVAAAATVVKAAVGVAADANRGIGGHGGRLQTGLCGCIITVCPGFRHGWE